MSYLSKVLENMQEYKELFTAVEKDNCPAVVNGLSQIHKVHVIHSLCEKFQRRAVIITPDEAQATRFVSDLSAIQTGVYLYPEKDFVFRNVQGQSREYEHKRLHVLKKIIDGDYTVVALSVQAALQLTIPPESLMEKTLLISQGKDVSLNDVIKTLLSAGYIQAEQVDGIGQFSHRGCILDFYPPGTKNPYRVEFWGDTIDTICDFDIETQRRIDTFKSAEIVPTMEVTFTSNENLAEKIGLIINNFKSKSTKATKNLQEDKALLEQGLSLSSTDKYISLAYEQETTIFDYVQDAMLFVSESSTIKERCRSMKAHMNEDISMLLEDGVLVSGLDKFTIDYTDLLMHFENMGAIYLETFPRSSYEIKLKSLSSISARQLSVWNGSLQVLLQDIEPALEDGYTICILAGIQKSANSLFNDLGKAKIACNYYENVPQELEEGRVNVISGGMSSGFDYPQSKFMLITHGNAAPKDKIKIRKHKAGQMINSLEELQSGDYVVHSSHGIGMFLGIHKITMERVQKDYIKIKYAKDDIVYVPVSQLDLVSKYIGQGENSSIKLHKLGGQEWQKAKTRVRKAVKDMAKELTKLYAQRMKTKGHAFMQDGGLQYDFEGHFVYDETQDQLRSIAEIKFDMERTQPMDRLLCGDVGFGKTEVALRAAFKCIAEGKQCAMLVPTTLLAMQHYQTILKRMEGYPLNIQMLSRFKTPSQKEAILKDLAKGKIDMVVGTHMIISKNIKFRDLGLLIIDEEQRFGVAQKEKLKEFFPVVDVLTLSATPIPRTLNMAMSGIRDMSLLEEAPQNRHPVQTYVIEHDNGVINEAIRKELRRGGQCYYLHNKVESITTVAARISKDLPDANVAVAHGKMTEEQLNEVWRKLLENEIDVLVCTTIIETGVDVSNVNTLIIEDADRMGLAQLHQLRGRVGRSSRRASAYLTFKKGKVLSEIATSRLSAIKDFTEFGSGFRIAMRDLEIRGAGNILGADQHGHMEAVGYDMYIKLLNEAVLVEKGEIVSTTDVDCLIDLQIQAFIPDTYIQSVPQRLSIYRRIAGIRNSEDVEDVYDELIDRFGDPPKSVQGLIEIALLRNTCAKFGIYEVKQQNDKLLIFLSDMKMEQLSLLSAKMRGRVNLNAGDKPHILIKLLPKDETTNILKTVLAIFSDETKA